MTDRREGLFIGAAMLGLVALPFLGLFAWMSVRLGEDFFIPAIIVGGVATVIVLRGPVGRALARRIEGTAPEPLSAEQMAELEDMRARMLELEERVDFAERLLARPEAERIERS